MTHKIVLTGISGTIAKYLIPVILENGGSVTALTRKAVSESYGATVLIGDLNNAAFVEQALIGANTVIHLAGLTRSSNSVALKKSNEDLTSVLVLAARRCNVRRFIFFSSNLAYDPVGPYGKSKLACEEIVSNSGLSDWIIYRLNPFIGSIGKDKNSTLARLIDKSRRGKALWLPSSSKIIIAPIFASDLARLIVLTIKYEERLQKVFNVAGASMSLQELITKATPSSKIYNIPIWLIKMGVLAATVAKVQHPMLESLRAIERQPQLLDPFFTIDLGFKTVSIDDLLK